PADTAVDGPTTAFKRVSETLFLRVFSLANGDWAAAPSTQIVLFYQFEKILDIYNDFFQFSKTWQFIKRMSNLYYGIIDVVRQKIKRKFQTSIFTITMLLGYAGRAKISPDRRTKFSSVTGAGGGVAKPPTLSDAATNDDLKNDDGVVVTLT
uniref:Uncharacterized protein n=1 Tax=Romanomermis culicivorax TaxID=13658 RepID=A0A915KMD4_ROMCU